MSRPQPPAPWRVRVKFCGITRTVDALAAASLGVDAIGLVFYPPSPRAVDAATAAGIVRSLPPFVSRVALFVDAGPEEIEAVLAQVPVDLLQFHGDETPQECARYGLPWIKALRMREGLDLERLVGQYDEACGILLDSYQPGVRGGTGRAFDWDRIPSWLAPRLVLAGGLNPENVGEAIRRVRPWAVDVSGGIEQSRGVKSRRLMEAFMRGVNHARAEARE
ncbi:MAG: phosphoribosylanthranilate isomerase [Gammaproteobacteria bacterium]|nr:MAG: phosphoribosylanthranilate isomerase [Gammaproteobacteria bacterium]